LDIEWEHPTVLCPSLTEDPGIEVRVVCEFADVDNIGKTQPQHEVLKMAFESVIDSDETTYRIDSDGGIRSLPSISVNLGNVRFSVKAIVWVAYREDTGELFEYLEEPLQNARISMNKQDRTTTHGNSYYSLLQPYLYGHRSCVDGPYCPPNMYAFSLQAMSRFHTGSANFGALTEVSLKADIQPNTPRCKVKVFALYHNVIEIKNMTAKVLFV